MGLHPLPLYRVPFPDFPSLGLGSSGPDPAGKGKRGVRKVDFFPKFPRSGNTPAGKSGCWEGGGVMSAAPADLPLPLLPAHRLPQPRTPGMSPQKAAPGTSSSRASSPSTPRRPRPPPGGADRGPQPRGDPPKPLKQEGLPPRGGAAPRSCSGSPSRSPAEPRGALRYGPPGLGAPQHCAETPWQGLSPRRGWGNGGRQWGKHWVAVGGTGVEWGCREVNGDIGG